MKLFGKKAKDDSGIKNEEIIWFPGVYSGREGVYAKTANSFPREELIELVQQRAKEDGEWAIENGFVGDNEDKMRKMMEFVSNEKHIIQCLEYANNAFETVDWICRDLANASKWAHGSDG